MKTSRRLAAVLLAALVLATTAAEPPAVAPVFHTSFKTASDAAAADQSLVLLIFSAEWCGPCKLLKSKTLSSPEFLHQDAALHVADVDIDVNQKMAGDFAIEAVPTLILLTPDGKIVSRQTGFMEAADLLAWLKIGRAHAAAGQWEGTVPGAQFDEFIKKAATEDIGTNDIQRLVELLGDADPANREQAGKILLDQREAAVPPLIEAVGNPYLGVRITASELLQRLAPNLTPVDPWQSPVAMSNAVVALRTWWASTGRLPEAVPPLTNSLSPNSIKEALEELRGDDAMRRTAAMTTLVSAGPGALPAVRDAIKRAERSGDQRALGLLEDVRWTTLVPDALEQQSGGVRNVLARGKSLERQAAAERLGRIGRSALGILIELAGDPDPLVVESAIRALSGISGNDSVPALAGLLSSADSNLRMTAAQALGHTKNAAAVKPLLAAMSDPDEVVACAAISGLEENQARESSYNRTFQDLPEETASALKRAMADPRWRVRATAAEAAGKLGARNLIEDLKQLLGDNDGFVVKSALTALGALNSRPEAPQLVTLSKRLPSLQGDAVEMLLQTESDETVKTVTDLFNSGNTDTRVAILGAFLSRGFYGYTEADEGWKPMLEQAIASPDARLRHVSVEVLSRRTPKLSAQLVGPLLNDQDPEIRRAAIGVVLQILAADNSGPTSRGRYFTLPFQSSSSPKTNQSIATAAQMAAWHTSLLQHPGAAPELSLAAAVFVTGDDKTGLPVLLAALENASTISGASQPPEDGDRMAIQALIPRLSLPDGRPVLEKLLDSPLRFAMAVQQANRCNPAVADYLLDPVRFKTAVEPADASVSSKALELLAGWEYEYNGNQGWSLWNESDHTKAVALALLNSTNDAWRAAAVFSLGLRSDAKDNLAVFEKTAADPSLWVRGSAACALARNLKDRATLEQRLAPLLADTNLPVARTAAVALLEPETRQAAGLDSELGYFQFESVRGGRSQSSQQNDERPLTTLDGTPQFLEAARRWLTVANGDDSTPFVLLLAQYGQFDGVDHLVSQLPTLNSDDGESTGNALLAGIALSRDPKYIPALKQLVAARQNEWELRKVLQAMKGMSGPDARQLRLDINKKIRDNTSSVPGSD